MKKIILSFIICFITSFTFNAFSQTTNDTITKTKVFGGYKYELNGKTLTLSQMAEKMKNNPEAFKYISNAQSNQALGLVIGCIGGFAFGWQIGTLLGGGEANGLVAAGGAALMIVSIPISSSANKDMNRAVDSYNNNLKQSVSKTSYEMRFGIKSDGLAFTFSF